MNNYKIVYKISVIIVAVLIALLVGAVIIIAVGGDVLNTYWIIISMPFKNLRSFSEVLIRMIPLLIVALGISVSSRCGIINIGAEGQMYMGIIAATAIATNCQGLPKFIVVPLCILAGAIAGGLYGFIPGWLKAKLEVSELLSTVMLNYVATQFFNFCIRVPLLDPNEKSGTPMSRRIAENATLSRLFRGMSLHQGIFLAAILVVVIYLLMFNTSLRSVYGPAVQWVVVTLSFAFIMSVAYCGYFIQPLIPVLFIIMKLANQNSYKVM